MQPLTVTEVSRASGISRGTIYRSLNDGRLRQFVVYDGAKRLLHPGVVKYLKSGAIRPRADSPWFGRDASPSPAPESPVESAEPDGWLEQTDVAVWRDLAEKWGRWAPSEPLTDSQFWHHAAKLMAGWLADPLPPLNALTASSYYMVMTEAVECVAAGYRWDDAQWAAAEREEDEQDARDAELLQQAQP